MLVDAATAIQPDEPATVGEHRPAVNCHKAKARAGLNQGKASGVWRPQEILANLLPEKVLLFTERRAQGLLIAKLQHQLQRDTKHNSSRGADSQAIGQGSETTYGEGHNGILGDKDSNLPSGTSQGASPFRA